MGKRQRRKRWRDTYNENNGRAGSIGLGLCFDLASMTDGFHD